MDKLQEWRISQKYKNQPLPFHQQRTLDFLKKTLLQDKPNQTASEKMKHNNAQNTKYNNEKRGR